MKIKCFFLMILFSGFFLACEAGQDSSEESAMGVSMFPLSETCSGDQNANPITTMTKLKLLLTGPDPETGEIVKLLNKSIDMSADGKVSIKNVPVGTKNDLTVLGYDSSSKDENPSFFGRRKRISVSKDGTNSYDMVLVRYAKSTCVCPPAQFTNRVFHQATKLGDGRILMTGGFTRIDVDQADPTLLTFKQPSDVALIYDPFKGEIKQVASNMKTPRAMHAAVYLPLPQGEQVILFGGAAEIKYKIGDTFPFQANLQTGLNSYEIFDVKTETFMKPVDKNNTEKFMSKKRILPKTAWLSDNTILVTGGGAWPEDSEPAYKQVEIYAPPTEDGSFEGGFLDLKGTLSMNVLRAGHAVEKIEDTQDGLSRYLVLGGTKSDKITAEIYTQSSKQLDGSNGNFSELKISSGTLPLLYFHTLTPLSGTTLTGKNFLVAGGVVYDAKYGKLKLPATEKVRLLTMKAEGNIDTLTVEEIDVPGSNRYFHSATSPDGEKVTIIGGFTKLSDTAEGDIFFFDLASRSSSTPVLNTDVFQKRALHEGIVLSDDTVLLVGGMKSKDTLVSDSKALFEIFCPENIKLDLAPND